jgi:aspartate/methionine/tyrosine aminotransferase
MTQLNLQFDEIRQSATVAMADRILALKASGQKIVGLQVGDPDFGTHPAILEADPPAATRTFCLPPLPS